MSSDFAAFCIVIKILCSYLYHFYEYHVNFLKIKLDCLCLELPYKTGVLQGNIRKRKEGGGGFMKLEKVMQGTSSTKKK